MIPALPEPAHKAFHMANHLNDMTCSISYFTAAQLEQYARDYHAAMMGEPVAKIVQRVIKGRRGMPDIYKYDFLLVDPSAGPCTLHALRGDV